MDWRLFMSRRENLEAQRNRSRSRRLRTTLVAVVALLVGAGAVTAGINSAFGAAQHGFSVSKGCEGPVHPGDALQCSYVISNNQPLVAHETWTIKSVIDQVTAPTGVKSPTPNLLSSLTLTFSPSSGVGAPTCNIGQTLCTLPYGSSISTDDISIYTVVAGDLAPDATLRDLVTIVGNDQCDAGASGCSTADAPQTAPASTAVVPFIPTTSTQLSATSAVLVGTPVTDQASLANGSVVPLPTGTMNYAVYSDDTCTTLVQDLGTKTLPGNGTIPQSDPYSPTAAGKFWFQATYSGDDINEGFAAQNGLAANPLAQSSCTSEPLSVVDAKITIASNKTNRVGDPHTFTVTLSKDAGDGAGFVVAAGEHVTVTLTDTNGAVHTAPTGSCTTAGPNTDGSGQCTITFTSNSTGVVTAHASSTLSIGGSPPLTVQTNGVSPNSPDGVKTFVNAKITIAPDATNRVGQPHTFTVTLSKDLGDGNGFVAAPSEHVDFTLTDGNGAVHTAPTGTCTAAGANTDGAGQCTIIFTSNTTGTVTGHAMATLSVGASDPFTVETDGTAPNSANAVKTFVNAAVTIAASATNEVGKSHTFTVTVTQDVGSNSGFVAAPGAHVDVTLTDSNGATHTAPTGSCTTAGPNTDGAGQCTITFTSNSAGEVTGHATATLSVGASASFSVETDGTSPNSGDVVKTFVDANISITPLSKTNPVGTDHVLTGHVNVNDGSSSVFSNAPDGTLITFSIASGPGDFDPTGVNTCTTSGGTGSCTVQITSTVTGTTTVSATTIVTVGGVPLTRTTGDGVHSDGANATKLWADDTVTTRVLNAANADITGTSVAAGTIVHDEATVAAVAPGGAGTPTGTVNFTLFLSNNCTGTVVASDSGEALNGSGVATSVPFTTPSTPASYSYLAHYNGQVGVYPAHDALCEPFSVQPAFTDNLTPGFWKNHQKATQPLLPLTLGNHVVSTFAEAKTILSGMGCGSDGRLNCMAGMLLAAELNLAQGGSTCIGSLSDPLNPTTGLGQANLLLIKYGYTGYGSYTLTAADSAAAQALHDELSAYNIDGVPSSPC